MPRKTDKRNRLVEAAKVLIHQQGFNLTTLADIAQEADVPLGNVYYYFKTKEAIGIAVIEKRLQEFHEAAVRWNGVADPVQRLMDFLHNQLDDIELIARFGCPVGGLCQELGKQGGPLADLAAKQLYDLQNWLSAQFQAIGFNQELSMAHSTQLLASVQGMFLLTHTFKDPKIAQRQLKAIESLLVLQLKEVKRKEEAFA